MNLYCFVVRMPDEDDNIDIQGLGNNSEDGLANALWNERNSYIDEDDDIMALGPPDEILSELEIKDIRFSQLTPGMREYLQIDNHD